MVNTFEGLPAHQGGGAHHASSVREETEGPELDVQPLQRERPWKGGQNQHVGTEVSAKRKARELSAEKGAALPDRGGAQGPEQAPQRVRPASSPRLLRTPGDVVRLSRDAGQLASCPKRFHKVPLLACRPLPTALGF